MAWMLLIKINSGCDKKGRRSERASHPVLVQGCFAAIQMREDMHEFRGGAHSTFAFR